MSRLSKQLKNKFCHGSQSNTSIWGGGGGGGFPSSSMIKAKVEDIFDPSPTTNK